MERQDRDSSWHRQVNVRDPPALLQSCDFLQKRKMAETAKEKTTDVEEISESECVIKVF